MIISYLQFVLIILASMESKTLLDINSGKQIFLIVTFEFDTNSPAIVWLFFFSHRFPQTLWGNEEYFINELFEPESSSTNKGLSHILSWIIFAVMIVYGMRSEFFIFFKLFTFSVCLFLYCLCFHSFLYYFLNLSWWSDLLHY